jgi:hypothetical protein
MSLVSLMSSVKSPLTIALLVLATAAAGIGFVPVGDDTLVLRDIDGVAHGSLHRPDGRLNVLFFLTADCPIANRYAPEIQRICKSYGSAGERCFLVYADPSMSPDAVRKHLGDFEFDIPAIVDRSHRLVKRAGATISSETAVFSDGAALEYRGRIDNFYAALGTPRQRVTEHDLRDALDALIAGEPVAQKRTEAFGCYIPSLEPEDRS